MLGGEITLRKMQGLSILWMTGGGGEIIGKIMRKHSSLNL